MTSFGSVLVPLITPEKREDFFPLIEHILAGGVKDLVFFGTTGDGSKIAVEEKKSLLRQISSFVKGQARLYVGLMDKEEGSNAEFANFAHDLGVAAALYPTQAYLGDAFLLTRFLQKTYGPIFLYHSPKVNYKDVDRIIPFIEKGRVVGVKDSSGDLTLFQELLTRFRSDFFKVFYGRESQLDTVLRQLSIDGFFSAAANLEPLLVMRIWQDKENEAFFEQFKQLKSQIQQENPESYIEAIKSLLKKRAIC
jgi:dihydrodipicolinate synthase/N-acetylneuraminate lyase